MSALIAWLGSEGLKILAGALFGALVDAWNSYQANQALRQLGAAEERAAVNKETSDANRRAADAAINAPDIERNLADMERGQF